MAMERPAGLAEAVFLATHLELLGSTQSVMAAEFVAPLPHAAIIDALCLLFRRQPMLRARLTGAAPHWGFVCDTEFEDVEIRIQSLGSSVLADIFAAECDNILDLATGPLWRALLISHEGKAVAIIVTFAHAIVDGVSAIAFMRQLLDDADAGAGAGASYPMRPAMEDLLPTPAALIEAAEGEPPPMAAPGEWPFDDSTSLSARRTNVVLGGVGADALDELTRRCRSERVSVDAFFVSGILAALARHIPAALSLPIICAFDARSELEPSVPAEEIGMYMKELQLFDPDWRIETDVWTRARWIRKRMRDQRRWVLDHPSTLTAAAMHQQIRLAVDYPLKSFPFGFSVSNLGRQPDTCGFRSLYLSSTDLIGIMGFQVVLTELRGELFVTFVHADPLIAPETITAIRDDVIDLARSASALDPR